MTLLIALFLFIAGWMAYALPFEMEATLYPDHNNIRILRLETTNFTSSGILVDFAGAKFNNESLEILAKMRLVDKSGGFLNMLIPINMEKHYDLQEIKLIVTPSLWGEDEEVVIPVKKIELKNNDSEDKHTVKLISYWDKHKKLIRESISINLLHNTATWSSKPAIVSNLSWYDNQIVFSELPKGKDTLQMDLSSTWSGFEGYDNGTMQLKRRCGYYLMIFPIYEIFYLDFPKEGK